MNVSHTCSQTCPGLNAFVSNMFLYFPPFLPFSSFPSQTYLSPTNQRCCECHEVGKKQSLDGAAGSKQLTQQMHEQEMQPHVQFLIPHPWLLLSQSTRSPAIHGAKRFWCQPLLLCSKPGTFFGEGRGLWREVQIWLGWEIPVGLCKTAQAPGMEPCPRLLC